MGLLPPLTDFAALLDISRAKQCVQLQFGLVHRGREKEKEENRSAVHPLAA